MEVKADVGIGLVVGLPSSGRKVAFEWGFFLGLQNYPYNTKRNFAVVKNKPIDFARNLIVENALKIDAKYIWFLDDDVIAPMYAVRRLMYDLEQADDDVVVAMGIYPSKETPSEPMIFQQDGHGAFWKWKKGEVFEVASGGTGCMMIRTEIFKSLPKPWFKTVDMAPNGDLIKDFTSDDIYFCRQVREAGYKLIADGNVICDHYDYTTDPPVRFMLPPDSYPMRDDEEHANNDEPTSVSAAL